MESYHLHHTIPAARALCILYITSERAMGRSGRKAPKFSGESEYCDGLLSISFAILGEHHGKMASALRKTTLTLGMIPADGIGKEVLSVSLGPSTFFIPSHPTELPTVLCVTEKTLDSPGLT